MRIGYLRVLDFKNIILYTQWRSGTLKWEEDLFYDTEWKNQYTGMHLSRLFFITSH